jgi:outer membrane protein OmpA-like peptidoglycan-associated protein
VPHRIIVPYFANRAEATHGFLSRDGQALVFSAESFGTYGAEDLYVIFQLPDGRWSEPRNLGFSINTKLQEVSPAFSEDGKYLYFSSNGRGGYGSFDVFVSERLDDSWLKWSSPVNLNGHVNSEGRELFYHPYARLGIALFTSTLNSDGYGDIKQVLLPKEQRDTTNADAAPIEIVEIAPDANQAVGDFLTVSGKIFDAKTNLPVSAAISFQSDSSFIVKTNVDGFYQTEVPKVKQYRLMIESPGYVSSLELFDVRSIEMKTVELNFLLQPIEVGTTVNLRNVLFKQSTAELLAESEPELDVVVDFLTKNPTVEIELAGHTDNRGLHAHNLKLSNERVKAVKNYLVAKGIVSKRVSGKGYGGTRPIADNDAEDTRRLNRRVEFTIIKRYVLPSVPFRSIISA